MQPLIAQFQAIELDAGALGLKLNHLKCEIIGPSDLARLSWQSSLPGIPEVIVTEASLLGHRLEMKGYNSVMKRMADFNRLLFHLTHLSSHESLFLLKSCLYVPKLL